MPDQYAAAVHDYLRAKVEQRTPEITLAPEGTPRLTRKARPLGMASGHGFNQSLN
jgi:hypothetical protein